MSFLNLNKNNSNLEIYLNNFNKNIYILYKN